MHTSAKFCIKLNKVAAAQLRPPAGLTAAHMPSGHTFLAYSPPFDESLVVG